jgi:alpha-glucoside transport system substrate-binding protein
MARYRFLAVPLMVAFIAAACTNKPAPGARSSPAATTSPAEASGPYPELDKAKAGAYKGAKVEILGQWIDPEDKAFRAALAPFVAETGIDVTYEGINDYTTVLNARVEGGNAPDLAQIAQPGLMRSFAESGKLVDLTSVLDSTQLKTDYLQSFIDLGSDNGKLYGVFYRANLKSIVWYPVKAFQDAGYAVPQTWEELVALSNKIVADGNGAPWCISQQQDGANGWVATDWVEDALLRTAPLETYNEWADHRLPFNDPAALHAADMVKEIWFTKGFAYGGSTWINATWVGDTQTPMFAKPKPKCWMHKQAAWIPAFWPKDTKTDEPLYTPGVDSSFFYFPPIDPQYGKPVLGAGDMFVMFADRPEVRAVLQYLATPAAAAPWIAQGGFLAANKGVSLDWYTTYPETDLAKIFSEATTFAFDASDAMPADVGQGTFWSGMVDWVAHDGSNTPEVFQKIESSWPSS